MIGYAIVIFFLAALIIVDALSAVKEYKLDKKIPKLLLHFFLLAILALIVVNSLFSVLKSNMEIPYFNMKIVHNRVHIIEG